MYCILYNAAEKRYVSLDCATTSSGTMEYVTTHGWTIVEYRSFR